MSAAPFPTPHKHPEQQQERDHMLDYYGLDWALLACGLTTKYLLIYQSRWAFATSILGCLAGLAVAIMAHQHGIAFYNVILIAMSCTGFLRWSKTNPTRRFRKNKANRSLADQLFQPTPATY